MEIIYDKDITIKMQKDTSIPSLTAFFIESDILYYTRNLAYLENMYREDIDINNIEIICNIILEDYKLFYQFYILGLNVDNVSTALTLHDRGSIFKQLCKFIKNNSFKNELILQYCLNNELQLLEPIKREIFFSSTEENNLFTCDFKELLSKETFIAAGSSRAVFKINEDYVIKVHLDSIGEIQSYNEAIISTHPDFRSYEDMLCSPVYTCREYSIYELCTPLDTVFSGKTIKDSNLDVKYDIDRFNELLELLDKHNIIPNDCTYTNNLGINKDNLLKILDFGYNQEIIELEASNPNPTRDFFDKAIEFRNEANMNDNSNKEIFNEMIFRYLEMCGITL